MNLIPLPYRILAGIVLMVGLIGAGFYEGHKIGANGVQVDWDKDKLARSEAQKQAILDRDAESHKVLVTQLENHAQEIKKYQGAIDELNKVIATNRSAIVSAGGLRIAKSICNQPTGNTKATDAGQSNGTSNASIELPTTLENNLLNLAEDADRETGELKARILICQQFAKDNGFAP